jgi:hypothetical protein
MTSSDEERQQRRDELDELCTGYKSSKFPSCPEVEPREIWESMNASDTTSEGKKFVIVDTRREEEHKVSLDLGFTVQCIERQTAYSFRKPLSELRLSETLAAKCQSFLDRIENPYNVDNR